MKIFKDIGFSASKKGIEVGTLRHKIVSQNIANISTPDYVSGEVVFEKLSNFEFKLQGACTNQAHLPIGRSGLDKINPLVLKSGSVDIDREMVNLAKNSINWNANIKLLGFKYKMLLMAINGR